jgi:hypothetical protein
LRLTRPQLSRAVGAAVALTLLASAAACSFGDGDKKASKTTSSTGIPPTTQTTGTRPATPQELASILATIGSAAPRGAQLTEVRLSNRQPQWAAGVWVLGKGVQQNAVFTIEVPGSRWRQVAIGTGALGCNTVPPTILHDLLPDQACDTNTPAPAVRTPTTRKR